MSHQSWVKGSMGHVERPFAISGRGYSSTLPVKRSNCKIKFLLNQTQQIGQTKMKFSGLRKII